MYDQCIEKTKTEGRKIKLPNGNFVNDHGENWILAQFYVGKARALRKTRDFNA